MNKKDKKNKLDAKSLCYLIFMGATIVSFFYAPIIGLVLLSIGIIILLFINRANLFMLAGLKQYNKKNISKALKLLKTAHMSTAGKMNNSYNYAYILLREGRIDDAKTAIKYALLRPNVSDAETYQGKEILSMIYYRQGQYNKATDAMQSVFEHYKNSNVYGALGYYKILAKAPDAEDFALEAYDYNKTDKVILDNLVQLYYEKGDYETAKKYSDKAIKAEHTGIETYYHAGLVLKALNNKAEAIDNFKKALSFTPSFLTTVTTDEIERQIMLCENE